MQGEGEGVLKWERGINVRKEERMGRGREKEEKGEKEGEKGEKEKIREKGDIRRERVKMGVNW